MKTITRLAGTALGCLLLASPALAVDLLSKTFAQYTQQSSDKVAHYGATGSGNTLSITDAPAFLVVTDYGPAGMYGSTLSMTASSAAPITNLGPQFEQNGWNGTMTFTNGINQLSVAFANAIFSYDGSGGSASLISTDPSHMISYSSDLMSLPLFNFRNFSLAFTGITPPFNVAGNGFGSAFSANTAGSFAGSAVPEPEVWATLLMGFGAIGLVARRRSASAAVAC